MNSPTLPELLAAKQWLTDMDDASPVSFADNLPFITCLEVLNDAIAIARHNKNMVKAHAGFSLKAELHGKN